VVRNKATLTLIPLQSSSYSSFATVNHSDYLPIANMSSTQTADVSAAYSENIKQATQDSIKCRSYFGLDRLAYWLRPTSEEESRKAEARFVVTDPNLNTLEVSPPAAYIRWVNIGKGQYINTLTLESPKHVDTNQAKDNTNTTTTATSSKIKSHGYGAGLAYFYRNFASLVRPGWRVYAIDWLGMGRSARVEFPSRPGKQTMEEYTEKTEEFFIDSLERWRIAQGIEKMTLAGHSMGGYMSSLYSLRYPERVERLVLISPVGIPEQPSVAEKVGAAAEATAGIANEVSATSAPPSVEAVAATSSIIDNDQAEQQNLMVVDESDDLPEPEHEFQRPNSDNRPRKIPGWVSTIWDRNFTPQWFVRAMGPFGPRLVNTYVQNRMAHLPDEDRADLRDYTYHISSAPAILAPGAHARHPLKDRLPGLKMPTTFIYGEKDWMDYRHAVRLQPNMQVETEVIRIPYGGHHMYMENPEAFAEAMQAEMEKSEQMST
ncbi:Alpha/Beta hydrolase protein, partial [Syncephalis plumigaleata]